MTRNIFDYNQMQEFAARLRALEVVAQAGHTSVSRGAFRILSSEGLIVVGSASTTGTQSISGRLEGSGTFDWTGPMWLRGSIMLPGNLTGIGTLLWSGPWELRGFGRITGKTTLEDDLEILPGGKIRVGDMTIDPTGNGSVTFANGATVTSGAGGVSLVHNSTSVQVTSDGATVSHGGRTVAVDGGGIRMSPLGIPQVTGTGLPENVLMIDPGTGYIRRTYS